LPQYTKSSKKQEPNYVDGSAKELALAGARSLAAMYNPALRLVPLGSQADEGWHVGNIETSIDSLHAVPFLFWAARAAGDEKMREVAHAHAATIIPLHRRADDSFIQSSTLDATGRLVKHYTQQGLQRDQHLGPRAGLGHPVFRHELSFRSGRSLVARGRGARRRLMDRARP